MPRSFRLRLVALTAAAAAVTVTVACSPPRVADAPAPAAPDLDLASRDLSVAPGDDFFAYVNGGWAAVTEIPPDRPGTGVFLQVFERTRDRLAELIDGAMKAPAGSVERKIGDYYTAYLDEAAIDARGTAPLDPLLRQIESVTDRRSLSSYLGGTLRADVDAFNSTDLYTDNLFGLWVAQDLDDPTRYVPFLLQGGLDMPDRAYYLDDSAAMADARTACLRHIAAVLELAGVGDADTRAVAVFELERRIAEGHWNRTDSGEVAKGNNHWSRDDFSTLAPGVDWPAFFAAAGLGEAPTFIVWQPSAVTALSALVAGEPLDTWRDYLTFHAFDHFADVLPKPVRDEWFDFHLRTLAGVPEMEARRKTAIAATSGMLGDAVGKLYVERYFPASAKRRIEAMVENIRAAFDRRIEALDWMAPETKAKAREKLATLLVGVGYPDEWRDDSGLEIRSDDAFGNVLRGELFDYHHQLAKLGRPASRSEWAMTPQTVNAVNLPVMNAMNFPAAILQPPFFDPERPEAMNYGAIGAVIGHEISHSFDDQGAKFDAAGRLADWWTDADRAHFEETGRELVDQYDAYEPLPGLRINGRLTLGENIADLAGLAAAYDAYRASLAGGEPEGAGGLGGDQLFFLAFAQSWRSKLREPALRQRLVGDGHSPAEYRVATVRNLDAWYAAYEVTPERKMYLAPEDRVRVW